MTSGLPRHSPAPQPHLPGGHGSSPRYSTEEMGCSAQGVKSNFKHISTFGFSVSLTWGSREEGSLWSQSSSS